MDRQKIGQRAKYCTVAVLLLALNGCFSSGGDDPKPEPTPPPTPTPTPTPVIAVQGAAVKGPLAHSEISVFALDLTASGFKGELIAQGATDAQAKISALEVPESNDSPLLIEFVATGASVDLTTGNPPVLKRMRDIITQQMLDDGNSI